MPRRFPLYAKILLWFFLNLALLAVMFWMPFRAQFRTGPDWLLPRDASDRIDAVSDIVLAELAQEPPAKWSETLHTFDSGYHNKVRSLAFDGHGQQVAGDEMDLPPEIRQRLMGPPGSSSKTRTAAGAVSGRTAARPGARSKAQIHEPHQKSLALLGDHSSEV